ncbi:MAG TPA: hypothetical protein VEK11_13820 [Thermoanaerobaculia bacterium]|nr:hypothetical protein [Thermoanaerobaculia bacterium]
MRSRTLLALSLVLAFASIAGAQTVTCPSPSAGLQPGPATIKAEIAAFNQPYFLNRYGAAMPQGMMFALKRDIVPINAAAGLVPGNVMLKPTKRPRPMVLRVRQGDCLQVTLWNYLTAPDASLGTFGVTTTTVSYHVNGLNLVNTIADDGALVGQNPAPSGNLAPSATQSITYTLFAPQAGTYLAYSNAATSGGNAQSGGQITAGLYGSVHVEPPGAEMYRSQVTAAQMAAAQTGTTSLQQPLLNYAARYPANYSDASLQCAPVLAMVATAQKPSGGTCVADASNPGLVTYYTDLTAIITGPNQGNFTANVPEFAPVSASPNRRQPYREFSIHYHEMITATQALPNYYWNNDPDPQQGVLDLMATVAQPGADNFGINYGTGAIGTEILSDRLNIGPTSGAPGSKQSACVECKFEEFFLTAWAVGDPAMVVDVPANSPNTTPIAPNANLVGVNYLNQLTKCALASAGTGKTAEADAATQCNSLLPGGQYAPKTGRKATRAYFPDDPSNVYHSYLNDHVIFRILHAGMNFTHVHHQHAHQWLHSPNSQNGSYLDSQLISPGAGFTLEMVYGGSGNRNKTVGDSIFHCHFYPHFAAGMWSLWRVHDVFEYGTPLTSGQPQAGQRALPDGEIAAGTPIPGIVPLPVVAMAPLPAAAVAIGPVCDPSVSTCTNAQALGFKAFVTGNGNPGYPFFIPGVAGHRPPRPPLDVACEQVGTQQKCYDGGLSRHLILNGTVVNERHNEWDFSKDNFLQTGATYMTGNGSLYATQLAESGEPVEIAAMQYMGTRNHPSFTQSNQPASFVTNGLPRKTASNPTGAQPGAPYADPAVDDNGNAVGVMRRYKAANIQTDVTFNKQGWHYPQQRFITLWGDVANTFNGTRAPEPFFFRANSGDDFVEFWHMNLVPSYYDLDDYQVRTPTDILGQHIHLVKFDVTSSDGAANGFNYEDGTLSPDEVRDRIGAIRNYNSCTTNDPRNGTFACPIAQAPPIAATPPPGQDWTGAQVTIQRWYTDPLQGCVDGRIVNCDNTADRTLRTVFTHDHFGPSTHQQTGLYAGLLIEPSGTKWTDPITGQQLGAPSAQPSRYFDGGPTSWQAIISANDQQPGYREFALEFQDLAHAYTVNSTKTQVPYNPNYQTGTGGFIGTLKTPLTAWGWTDCADVIAGPNNPGAIGASPCPNNIGSNPGDVLPGLIDASAGIGTMLVNYRNEPLAYRTTSGTGGGPNATDMAHVYQSMTRNNSSAANVNTQPNTCFDGTNKPCRPGVFYYPGPFPGAQSTDPYTPLLQAYQGDNVQVRVLVGAHFFNHNFGMQGLNWLFEPSNGNSGWRDNQAMGISEHFEYLMTIPSTAAPTGTTPAGVLPFTDYLYTPGSGTNDQSAGLWGILRAYTTGGTSSKLMTNLKPAPNNPAGGTAWNGTSVCPGGAPQRNYTVAAINGQAITYNSRTGSKGSVSAVNPNPLLYVPVAPNGTYSTAPSAPLVLRANAGDCVTVTLQNKFTTTVAPFTNTSSVPSTFAGIHPQLVATNAARDNGVNVGFNPTQYRDTTAANGSNITYQWYMGNVNYSSSGALTGTPIEFGSANLIAADPLNQQPYALIGSLIVEPKGSIWCNATKTVCSSAMGYGPTVGPVYDTTADVYSSTGSLQYREFVAMVQDGIKLNVTGKGTQNGVSVNFGTEPMFLRFAPNIGDFNNTDMSAAFSNFLVNPNTGSQQGEPQTPIFTAPAGMPVRFRMLHPDGPGGFPDNVFTLHGHVWQEEPYVNDAAGNPSAVLGTNPLSQWMGARDGFGSGNHFDILFPSAGGPNKVAGDYLYGSFPVQRGPGTQEGAVGGFWGVFRVTPTFTTEAASAAHPPIPTPAVRDLKEPAVDPGERLKTPTEKENEGSTGQRAKPPASNSSGNNQ